MSANRRAAEAVILQGVEQLLPGSTNTQLYKDLFASMSDQQFKEFVQRLKSKEIRLSIIAPNLTEPKLSLERNLKLAEQWGHPFFERIWIDRGDGTPTYLSPLKYLVVQLPLRRQAQLRVKKISIPEDNKSVDDLSGQPTGKSKGSKISYPETQILAALKLDANLTEMLKYRGGDIKGFDAMNTMISKTGGVSQEAIAKLGTKVKSTETMHIVLTAMHLQNSL